MFELMYQANGIGLAANQVDLPLQLFVINTTGDKDTGEELVFINPIISQPKGTETAEEGCLSIPGINGQVSRPSKVNVTAYDLAGNEINKTVSGLLARAVQHENDHLNGILFVDRLLDSEQKQIQPELDEFILDFQGLQSSAKIPPEQEIRKRLAEIENEYC